MAGLRRIRGKTAIVLALSLAMLALALAAIRSNAVLLQPVRNLVFDGYQILTPRPSGESAVVIVDIDEQSIRELGQWPWPRTTIAELTRRLAAAGAMAIGYDLVFSEPDRTSPSAIARTLRTDGARDDLAAALAALPDNDAAFADAIAAAPVVLGFFDGGDETTNAARRVAGISWAGEDGSGLLNRIGGTIASLPLLQENASGIASISLAAQGDDIVREVPLFISAEKGVFPGLSVDVLRVAIQNASGAPQSFLIKSTTSGTEVGAGTEAITEARVANFIFPLTRDGSIRVYYSRHDPGRTIGASRLLSMNPEELAAAIEGRIVLVGTSAVGLRDIRNTALREAVAGVEVHAQIIDQIMQGAFLARPDWAPGFEWLIAALVSLSIILVSPVLGPMLSALAGATGGAVILAVSWIAFRRFGILIDPLVPLALGLLTYILTTILLFAFAEREKRFVRSAFQQYLSPELLNRLEQAPENLRLGGEIRELTLMFMDIRGFTAISEKLDPQALVAFLNALLSPLSEIIQRHDGAIDKYIGDSIMAFWNAPLDVPDHPRKACLAALDMLAALERMNREDRFGFRALGLPPVEIGIGINTGDACVGNMGSASRFDYSVVGDAVNVAARLEFASKEARAPILASTATRLAAPELAWLAAGSFNLKGKTGGQDVHALFGDAAQARTQEFTALAEAHQQLIAEGTGARARRTALSDSLRLASPSQKQFLIQLSDRTGPASLPVAAAPGAAAGAAD